MKILITGITGMIGLNLAKKLINENHEIVGLVRNLDKAKRKINFPCTIIEWDSNKIIDKKYELSNIDIVVNLMGEPIANKRWSKKQKNKIYNSRIIGTKNLIKSLRNQDTKTSVLIGASAIGIYGDRGDETLDEDSSISDDWIANLCKDWEKVNNEASSFIERIINLRIGLVLSKEDGLFKRIYPFFNHYLGGRLGNGKQWMSWIHIEDLLELIKYCMFNDIRGPINAVSSESVRNIDFTRTLANVLSKPAIFIIPKLFLKLLFGEMSILFISSQKIKTGQLINSNFKYTDLYLALQDLVKN